MALTVLKVPIVSISMTDLKPLGDRPAMGATKLPAAPALDVEDGQYMEVLPFRFDDSLGNIHDKVNSTKLFNATIRRGLEAVEL